MVKLKTKSLLFAAFLINISNGGGRGIVVSAATTTEQMIRSRQALSEENHAFFGRQLNGTTDSDDSQCYSLSDDSNLQCPGVPPFPPSQILGMCSGDNGNFPDTDATLGFGGDCHCLGCFTGPDCDVPLEFNDTQCTVSPIDPEQAFYNEWFSRRSEAISVFYPNYGMEYRWWGTPEIDPSKDQLKAALFTAIKDVHDETGNVAIDDGSYRLIVGLGAHQVVASAIHALSQDGPKFVMHKKPHWIRFGPISRYANTKNATWWEDDETMIPTDWPENDIIEIVTLPNNPDNAYYEPAYENSVKIFDRVYYWPNQQEKEKIIPVSEDIMIFSMSKLASMPDVRISWAWVKDEIIAERMAEYISSTVLNVPGPAAFRCAKLLNAIVNSKDDGPDEFFTFGNTKLRARYEQMKELVEGSDGKFSLISEYGVFFMIKCDGCNGSNAENCCELAFDSVGIGTRLGSRYGYNPSDGIVMTCLGDEDPDYEVFYKKFEHLANDQDFVFEQVPDEDDDDSSQNENDEDDEEKKVVDDSGGVRGSSFHALAIITVCAALALI